MEMTLPAFGLIRLQFWQNNNIFKQQSFYSNKDCHQISITDGSPIGRSDKSSWSVPPKETSSANILRLRANQKVASQHQRRPTQLATYPDQVIAKMNRLWSTRRSKGLKAKIALSVTTWHFKATCPSSSSSGQQLLCGRWMCGAESPQQPHQNKSNMQIRQTTQKSSKQQGR